MAFANKDPFVCCIGGCFRKAWVDDDIGDFLCFVVDTAGSAQPPPAAHSRRQSRSRSRSRRRNPSSVVQPAHSV